jgi:hypothetical protein
METIRNWGTQSPVQFKHAVTPQMLNTLSQMLDKVDELQEQMVELTGGERGRDFTDNEQRAYLEISEIMSKLHNARVFGQRAIAEEIAIVHDGGPDIADGAPSNGVLI